jgi:hypothetical protein
VYNYEENACAKVYVTCTCPESSANFLHAAECTSSFVLCPVDRTQLAQEIQHHQMTQHFLYRSTFGPRLLQPFEAELAESCVVSDLDSSTCLISAGGVVSSIWVSLEFIWTSASMLEPGPKQHRGMENFALTFLVRNRCPST